MSSDSDHRSSKYRRSSSHRKKHRSSSSSSNDSRQRSRQSHYRSRRRHHSSSDSSSDSYSRSRHRQKSSKSSRNDRNGSVSSHQLRRKKSRTPDTPPRQIKREVRNQTFDLSQISSSREIDKKYFENDGFRIKPFESKKSSTIVYNLETQAITVPNKLKDEFNGSTECTLNTKLFEMDEIRWRRWNEYSKEEFHRLTKLYPSFYKKDDSIIK